MCAAPCAESARSRVTAHWRSFFRDSCSVSGSRGRGRGCQARGTDPVIRSYSASRRHCYESLDGFSHHAHDVARDVG